MHGPQRFPANTSEVNDRIALVRFNRPSQRNPLSLDTLHELQQITGGLFARDDVDAVIFTGADDVFASAQHT